MSNKPRENVRKTDTDPRVERSTSLLGHALIELIQERDFARMLAGALVESISWWRDLRDAATPEQMDLAFHEFARGVLTRAS